MEERQNAAKILSDFSKKLKAFASSGEKDPEFKSGYASLQEKINEREAVRYSNIISYYKKFTTPSAAIAEDQENLLKAYELFKGLRSLNQTSGDEHTFIKGMELISPLTQKERYTSGGDFIYLTAWFLFEKKTEDFAPVLSQRHSPALSGSDGSETSLKVPSYTLDFVPLSKKAFSLSEREILGIIKSEFYSTGTN